MRRIGYRLLASLLVLTVLSGASEPPPALRRGINITNWFRFPPSRDPAALRRYIDDATLVELKRAGFTFVRLPVQPELLSTALTEAIARIERRGLAVVVVPFADPAEVEKIWRSLAPMLRNTDPALTFPELLNEPVFSDDPGAWARLQHKVLTAIRDVLPSHTIVLTGANWSSVAGLLALSPKPDPNVIYSFHIYDPPELTALGSYRSGLDAAAMARLPFPVADEGACRTVAASTQDGQTAELIHFYCAQRWDARRVGARIAAASAWGQRHHVALLAGEFGASARLNASARLAWLATVREACERNGIGWALWGYDDSMGFARRPQQAHRQLDRAVLQALGLTVSK